jgi:hypothetical protein
MAQERVAISALRQMVDEKTSMRELFKKMSL